MTTMDWRHRAACRDEDPELFFPVGYTGPAQIQTAQAKAVCRGCPVIEQCLRFALEHGLDDGVFGGTSEQERRAIRRRERRTAQAADGVDDETLVVDPVVVQRRLDGEKPGRKLRHVERVEVARRVLDAGGGYNRVMAVLHCNGSVAGELITEARVAAAAMAAAAS